ncbi:MAG: DUF4255 domain-containing protein [Gammaproteobacteria bacterium]|nr:DUF4255 domain-containing protein [Gammaproteobacteria bacterium]MBU2004214.1 DUF4255 domain-containing protein [Gammaproteobacteria bacterium]
MSENAIFDATQALRTRLGEAVGGVNQIHVGPPVPAEVGESKVSLFLFHLQVNQCMRNEILLEPISSPEPATLPATRRDVLPLDLRFLITVFRSPEPAAAIPNELTTLGQIIQILQAEPTLPIGSTGGYAVRVTPEPYPMEEVSRVWGLFPQDIYRTSMVYLASPVMVDARRYPAGEPVLEKTMRNGIQEANA